MFSGAAFGFTSVMLIAPTMGDKNPNSPNLYAKTMLATSITAGGLLIISALLNKKYKRLVAADRGFKLTASPLIFSQHSQLSYGVGLQITF